MLNQAIAISRGGVLHRPCPLKKFSSKIAGHTSIFWMTRRVKVAMGVRGLI
jgi:hypothetical protein